MGQFKTSFRDTLRLFQVTNGHRESFHKKTVKGKKWYIIYLFMFQMELEQEAEFMPVLFVSVLVMIQMLHKDTAGRKS